MSITHAAQVLIDTDLEKEASFGSIINAGRNKLTGMLNRFKNKLPKTNAPTKVKPSTVRLPSATKNNDALKDSFKSGAGKVLGTVAVALPLFLAARGITNYSREVSQKNIEAKAYAGLRGHSDLEGIEPDTLHKYIGVVGTVAPEILKNKDIAANVINKMHNLGYDLSTLRELSNINKGVRDSNTDHIDVPQIKI